jgi:ATP adenylyltransferase/5',5'''-P-1,P-4-tetraphosphate phosphorylase II
VEIKINNLFENQLRDWDLAKTNFEALQQVKTKELNVDGALYKVQFNPARIVSSGAKVDAKSIQERKCFLCEENRPDVQTGLNFEAQSGEKYTILVNPFPIFPKHFTIPLKNHLPQLIKGRFIDMLDLSEEMSDFVLFYNGPKCGASAPDHFHFQAGNKDFLPLQNGWKNAVVEKLMETEKAKIFEINYSFPAFAIAANDKAESLKLFETIYQSLPVNEGENEPMMNILTWYENKEWITIVIPRSKHRPDCYFEEDEKNILLSPASVDLGGVFITPLEKDFDKLTSNHIQMILNEVCFDKIKI